MGPKMFLRIYGEKTRKGYEDMFEEQDEEEERTEIKKEDKKEDEEMKDAKNGVNLEMGMEMNVDMEDQEMKLGKAEEKKEDKIEDKLNINSHQQIQPMQIEGKPILNNKINSINPPAVQSMPTIEEQFEEQQKINGIMNNIKDSINNSNNKMNNINNIQKIKNGINDKESIKKLADVIKRLSKTGVYHINLLKDIPEITDSKLGGYPYWPNNLPYPKNIRGRNLYLLAQINFEKEKTEAPFPTTGILQFFIDGEDIQTLGANFTEDQTKQKNFRIIYHNTIDATVNKESVMKVGAPTNIGKIDFPVQGEHKIKLEKDEEYSNLYDIRFNSFFAQAYKEVFNKDMEKSKKFLDVLGFDGEDLLEIELEPKVDRSRHKMLGYAAFAQEDPRYKPMYKDYDTLLLQIDTEWNYIIWGDCGICNFFIKKQDLINKNFNNVLFNWDCS
jgi:uncharacterized protein YwqG